MAQNQIDDFDPATEDLAGDLIKRAVRAYCTRERRAGNIVQQPSSDSSYMDSYVDDLGTRHWHAVLNNVNGVLSVYRMKDDGHIEFVTPDDWPAWLVEAESEASY